MSVRLQSQIHYLHKTCPTNKEWSGLLIYRVLKGSVDELDKMMLSAEAMFPMDFGSETFTSFEGDERWIKCFERFPKVDPVAPTPGWYVGKIHSHHSMQVFHSPTDIADLQENTSKLPMFLSLIVNYNCYADCKLAIPVEKEETVITKTVYSLKGLLKKKKENSIKKQKTSTIYTIDCDVIVDQEDWFVNQVQELSDKSKQLNKAGFDYNPKLSPKLYDNQAPKKLKKNIHTSTVYALTIQNLSELLSLGVDKREAAYTTLRKVDREVHTHEKVKYKNAIKMYFTKVWFDSVFPATVTVDDVIESTESFLSFHKDLWITKILKEALNELKEEHYSLW